MSRNRHRRWLGVAFMVGVLIGTLGPGATGVLAKAPAHCITPAGTDLNVSRAVTEWIVAPFCTEIRAGHRWTVANPWFMSKTFDVVPPSFVPAGSTPLEDFAAKFAAIRYVVDPGSAHQKTIVFTNVEDLTLRSGPTLDFADPITLGSLSPLTPGTHVVDSYFVMSGLHCDGLADSVVDNCLQGVVLFNSVEFTVATNG